MSRISDHFTWREATVTVQRDPETGLLIPNEPGPEEAAALVGTFQAMEQVRALLGGRPIVVHSAYRSPAVNRAVGGSANSQHMKGEAVDFHVVDVPLREAFEKIRASAIRFDQLIEEAASWLHVSFASRRPPRRQALVMQVVDGRARYRAA